MPILGDLAKLIRSKNAGPFTLTFDVMFDDEATYRHVVASRVLTRARFAAIYGVPEEKVMFFEHDAARAIKISIPRPYVQCDLDDGDAYGGQQHAPLVELEVPDPA
ncbi:DUF4387 domain-containing protein [Falsiroseomonas sp.]|uniref:DUF4387 domain-containing protein n=1 Tax=Falsiroseomonas sp. TaxID=2870721 RepID=UPI00356599D1